MHPDAASIGRSREGADHTAFRPVGKASAPPAARPLGLGSPRRQGAAMARRDITGAVNFRHLESFAGGDQQVVDEVLELFREQAAMWARLLDPAGDGWRDAAHSLKGSA